MRLASFLTLTLVLPIAAWAGDSGSLSFNRDIRPILSENCFHCHGPDEEARQAGLRLDTEQGAKEWVIVEGDSEASELVDRILSNDPDLQMPPPDSERSLSAKQIETLQAWVDAGANYESHWSFIPPRQPPLPQPQSGELPIDQFVHAKLRQRGLTAAPPADPATLIRRVTFDLTGLPPTRQEIEAFVADPSELQYRRLIDRLLARPAFGERMASDWLDAARYSDTYGYQVDRDRFVWPWRDWVVDAFNRNLPYDQFLTEQLAGDLLPNATRQQVLATTFNRLHPQKVEGGSVPEEFRIEYVADRTQTVATAMLGLTFECCRCHTHKYDPLSQREYYQLSAFFDNIDEAGLYSFFTQSVPTPTLALPTEAQQQSLQQKQQRVERAEQRYREILHQAEQQDLQDRLPLAKDLPEDFFAEPIKALEFDRSPPGGNTLVEGVKGKAFRLTGDDAVDTEVGNFPRWQPFSISLWIKTPDVKERAVVLHRSRAWTDAASRGYQLLIEDGKLSWSLIHFWPGNAIRIRTIDPIEVDQWKHVTVTYDGSSRADGLQIYLDGRPAETEVVRDQLDRKITGGGGDHIAIGQRFRDRGFTGGQVDRLRVFDQQLTELEARRLATVDESTDWLSENWQDYQLEVKRHLARRGHESVKQYRQQLAEARQAFATAQDQIQEIMVMRELDQPRPSYLLERGAYDRRGQQVDPGVPAVLPEMPSGAPANRLGLAKWLTRPDHPLTSRVAVNRLWQLTFGTGLVSTPEDFGSQGSPPSHPELLDWLAVQFVQHDWDIKWMLKQIMLSDTYRRSSHHPAGSVAKQDPTNRLLARFPSYRLPAEMLRDTALAISGRLVRTVGGPPVKPYELAASFKPSKPDTGAGLYRRSLYTYWKRTSPAPAMMTFDAAKRDVCRVQREKTSSPLQAFVMLNGPQYVEAARGLAEQFTEFHGDDRNSAAESIAQAFQTLTGRRPTSRESEILVQLYREQRDYFAADAERTEAYLNIGRADTRSNAEPSHLAALTVVIGAVMNYDQSMMKR